MNKTIWKRQELFCCHLSFYYLYYKLSKKSLKKTCNISNIQTILLIKYTLPIITILFYDTLTIF